MAGLHWRIWFREGVKADGKDKSIITECIQVQADISIFIISQLVMFYAVFGVLSIYNKAYAKETDRLQSMYKNRIQLDVTVGNSQDMFNYISNGVEDGNMILGGKLSLSYAQISANTKCEVILKSNEELPYKMVSGRLPGSEPGDSGKRLIAVGRYKYKDAYEMDGKMYVTLENEEYEICGVIGSSTSDYYDYKMVLNIDCLGTNVMNEICRKDSYTIELSSNTRSLDNSYSAVFGNIRSVDAKSQINAKKLNSKGESDVVKALQGENMKINVMVYVFCIFNCLLMSQFWLIQRSREIAVKKIYGMSDLRIIGAMACNILALSVTALIIFAVSAAIINVVTSGAGIITVNLTTLLTTIAAIAVTIILSMAYPVIKILHYDSVEVLGSDD